MAKSILQMLDIIEKSYDIIKNSKNKSEVFKNIQKNTDRLDEIIMATPEYEIFHSNRQHYESIDDQYSFDKELELFQEFLMTLRESNPEVVIIVQEQEFIENLVNSNAYFIPLEEIYLNLEQFVLIFEEINHVSEIIYRPELMTILINLSELTKELLDEFPDYQSFENVYKDVHGYVINQNVYEELRNLNKHIQSFI